MICQSNNEGCWGPLCFCSCKPTPYPRPPWRCFGSLDIHLCRAREEEQMGVPQRQIWAKVDKEQERTRRWRRGFLNFCWRDGKAEVPHTSPRRWLGQCTALGLHLWLQEKGKTSAEKKCFLLSIARITWPPPPHPGNLVLFFGRQKQRFLWTLILGHFCNAWYDDEFKDRYLVFYKTSVLSSSERHIFVKKIPQAITPSS